MQKGPAYESIVPAGNGEEKSDAEFLTTPKQYGILAVGSVLACCVMICPCFYRKRRESSHTDFTKEQNSSEFVSYFVLHFDY